MESPKKAEFKMTTVDVTFALGGDLDIPAIRKEEGILIPLDDNPDKPHLVLFVPVDLQRVRHVVTARGHVTVRATNMEFVHRSIESTKEMYSRHLYAHKTQKADELRARYKTLYEKQKMPALKRLRIDDDDKR